jgi:Protein of unknown function (DUF3604)
MDMKGNRCLTDFAVAAAAILVLSAACPRPEQTASQHGGRRLPLAYSWSAQGDRVEVIRPREFAAGRWEEAEVAITIVGQPLKAGESIALGVPFGFPPPVLDDPAAEGYLRVWGPAGVKLAAEKKKTWEHFVWVRVLEGVLNPGGRVVVHYGDRSGGSPGVRPFPQAPAAAFWPVFREAEMPAVSPFSGLTPVRPGGFAGLRIRLPAVARPGERVLLRVTAQDAWGNCPNVSCRAAVINRAGLTGLPEAVRLRNGMGTAEFPAPPSGTVRLVLRDEASGIEAVSNPMEITASGDRVFFGDLHVHTELSMDAGGTLDEMYSYARDIAGLDFAAASDHQAAIRGIAGGTTHHGSNPCWRSESMPERWAAAGDAAKRFNAPGRFVTFAGFEFAPNGFSGHRNVYWPEDSPPMIEAEFPGENRFSPASIERLSRDQRLLIIPHHPAIAWQAGIHERGDPITYGDLPDATQPVVEIYSKHGTSECLDSERPLRGQVPGHFVSDFLEQGHRFGFIGGSDTHNANPGSTLREGPYSTLRFRAGLAAVWADDLSRESIWKAIFARRTYATTGPKILLRFSVGNLSMGEEGAVVAPRRIRVEARGEEPLVLIEIVKNGRVIGRWDPLRSLLDAVFEAEDALGAERDVDYYYARVRQHDGERAWSSPIWVMNPRPAR